MQNFGFKISFILTVLNNAVAPKTFIGGIVVEHPGSV